MNSWRMPKEQLARHGVTSEVWELARLDNRPVWALNVKESEAIDSWH